MVKSQLVRIPPSDFFLFLSSQQCALDQVLHRSATLLIYLDIKDSWLCLGIGMLYKHRIGREGICLQVLRRPFISGLSR